MKIIVVFILTLISSLQLSAQTEEFPHPPHIPSPNVNTNGEDEIVGFPDLEAFFPGGSKGMKKWISDNITYPKESLENGDQGRVYVVFIVEIDGSVSDVKVMRLGVTKELNKEALRLIESMPKWTPGSVIGEPIRTRCRVPVVFVLQD